MIFSDDVEMLERCQQGLAKESEIPGSISRAASTAIASTRTAASPARRAKCRCGFSSRRGSNYHDSRGGMMLGPRDPAADRTVPVRGSAGSLDAGHFEAWLELYEPAGHLLDAEPAGPDRSAQRRLHHLRGSRHPFDPRAALAGSEGAGAHPDAAHHAHRQQYRVLEAARRTAFTVDAAFICVEHQAEQQRIYSGRHTYHLDARRRVVPHQDETRRFGEQRRHAFADGHPA